MPSVSRTSSDLKHVKVEFVSAHVYCKRRSESAQPCAKLITRILSLVQLPECIILAVTTCARNMVHKTDPPITTHTRFATLSQ